MTFLKLNILGVLYAFIFFIQTELLVNVYRIARITGWENDVANIIVNIATIAILVLISILNYFLTKNLFGMRKIKYVIPVLWIPYYIIFIYIFSLVFPVTNHQEMPLPGIGILLIGMAIVYPFYISLINFFATIRTKNVN